MVSTRRKRPANGDTSINNEADTRTLNANAKTVAAISYEEFREERIKENKERMQKLGLFDLSLKLNSNNKLKKSTLTRIYTKRSDHPLPLSSSPRRSSRLKGMTPVSYFEMRPKRKRGVSIFKDLKIRIEEGSQPEIYTEEHEKLLGDNKQGWVLFVDGYGKDGKRIYDSANGETCHQCRQKTLGRHTHCSQCTLVQGQFCGDCLFMRYGENVIEVNKNPNWICPVCRGICNCSLCRKARGWAPTGAIYRKVAKLGYKSVAHYLIQTQRKQIHSENSSAASLDLEGTHLAPEEKGTDDKSIPVDEPEDALADVQSDEHGVEMEEAEEEEKQVRRSDDDDVDTEADNTENMEGE